MRRIILLVAMTCTAAVAHVSPADAARPIMTAVCWESHVQADDPVVYPGRNNAAHLHDFSGSYSTNENSTYASMTASGNTCNQRKDTAGYWTPSVYDAGGRRVRKVMTFAYYVQGAKDNYKTIKAFPADLKMIADLSASFSAAEGSSTGFRCDGDNDSRSEPYQCASGGYTQIRIVFPDCWDGENLDSPNHRSHMAYAGDSACPSSHPVPVPRLQFKSTYASSDLRGMRLASEAGSTERKAYGTYHADFWNTWSQPTLEQLVRDCINSGGQAPDTAPCEPNNNDPVPGTENPNYPNPTLAAGSIVACNDGRDNDGDSKIDLADPGCSSSTGTTESDLVPPSDSVPPPTSSCNLSGVLTGTLAAGETQTLDKFGRAAGTHYGCLTMPSNANFDLLLKQYVRTCLLLCSYSWRTVASSASTTLGETENIVYRGAAGDYRWYRAAKSGGGAFVHRFDSP